MTVHYRWKEHRRPILKTMVISAHAAGDRQEVFLRGNKSFQESNRPTSDVHGHLSVSQNSVARMVIG